jgi:diguanylate cyclase (GGDEF)-like protein
MAITRAEPITTGVEQWRLGSPSTSVRSSVLAGFGLLVVILAAVVAGSAWQVKSHQNTLAAMEHHTAIADMLQETQLASGESVTFLFGYVTTGNELAVPFVRSRVEASQEALEGAAAIEREMGHDHVERMDELVAKGAYFRGTSNEIIALRQSGEPDAAAARMQVETPAYQTWILQLGEATKDEQREVTALKSRADRAGDLAFWLLVLSGAIGGAIGIAASILIARSILKPLSSLEATARAVGDGNMDARAPVTGPRELAHLGQTLNFMVEKLEQRERELVRSNDELQQRHRQLVDARAQAATDGLTGLRNHRKFHERVREEVSHAEAEGGNTGLVMLDLDGFKKINDSKGHLAGDEILRRVSVVLAEVAGIQHTYRYGGDEFAVLLPGSDREQTAATAEQLRGAVESRIGGDGLPLTVSLGVAAYPQTAGTAEELIYRADAAMYHAKGAGKNRVAAWGGDGEAVRVSG